jgi:hypothetical protein
VICLVQVGCAVFAFAKPWKKGYPKLCDSQVMNDAESAPNTAKQASQSRMPGQKPLRLIDMPLHNGEYIPVRAWFNSQEQ